MIQLCLLVLAIALGASSAAECTSSQIADGNALFGQIVGKGMACRLSLGNSFGKKDCDVVPCKQAYELATKLPNCDVRGAPFMTTLNPLVPSFYQQYTETCVEATIPITPAPTTEVAPSPSVDSTNAPSVVDSIDAPSAVDSTNAPSAVDSTNAPSVVDSIDAPTADSTNAPTADSTDNAPTPASTVFSTAENFQENEGAADQVNQNEAASGSIVTSSLLFITSFIVLLC